jgi:hypothetical protein
MKNVKFLALGFSLASLTACQTAKVHSEQSASSTQAPASHFERTLASETALIMRFVNQLAEQSAISSRDAFDTALVKLVNEKSSTLAGRQIRSVQELESLKESEQKRLMNELTHMPSVRQKLELSSAAVKRARNQALSYNDINAVSTSGISDLRRPSIGSSTESDTALPQAFSRIVSKNPSMKAEIASMLKQNENIASKIGTPVINPEGCSSLEQAESFQNLELIVSGTDKAVESQTVHNVAELRDEVQKETSYVRGVSRDQAKQDICALADPAGPCKVFTPAMCE